MSDWTCPSCTFLNSSTLTRCGACETSNPKHLHSSQHVEKPSKPKKAKDDDEEEEEEEYEGSSSGSNHSDDEEINLRESKGFDVIVGGALAKDNKQKLSKLAEATKKKLGDKKFAFLDYEEDNCVLRASFSLDFLDPTVAKVWGLRHHLPVIIEFKFRLEDISKPPLFRLLQTDEKDITKHKLKEYSFGLEWQLRARLDEWLNRKDSWPYKSEDWILDVLKFVTEKINQCTKTCMICDGPLPFEMIKPSVCSKMLCVHSYEQYGLGSDVPTEIRENPDVVDLLINLCYAISQGDFKRFNPFPLGIEVKIKDDQNHEIKKDFLLDENTVKPPPQPAKIASPDNKSQVLLNPKAYLFNLPSVKSTIEKFPSVEELSNIHDSRSLKSLLDAADPLAFPLLRWVITSNRAHLALLPEKDQIKEMSTPFQYMFLSSPPEKEYKFQQLKKEKGSFWAFHGSNFANWHSILRIGLKNYSFTDLMSAGAAYGSGIYLSPLAATSIGYSYAMQGWKLSKFNKGGAATLQCIALCEVIDGGYKANPHYVIPNEDHVLTRYLFIYNGQYVTPNAEASKLKGLKTSPLGDQNEKKK